MKFTVVWSKLAQDRLADIWLNSAQRAAVTSTSDRIDVELANDPLRHAKQLSDKVFELEAYPLLVVFSWNEADRRVTIENVRELGRLEP